MFLVVLTAGAAMWWRWRSYWAPACLAVCGGVVWAAVVAAHGAPRPANHDMFADFSKITILAHKSVQGQGIYLWVDGAEPIAYRLPWRAQTARNLRKAADDAQKVKTKVLGRRKHDGRWVFHPMPPATYPEKKSQ